MAVGAKVPPLGGNGAGAVGKSVGDSVGMAVGAKVPPLGGNGAGACVRLTTLTGLTRLQIPSQSSHFSEITNLLILIVAWSKGALAASNVSQLRHLPLNFHLGAVGVKLAPGSSKNVTLVSRTIQLE